MRPNGMRTKAVAVVLLGVALAVSGCKKERARNPNQPYPGQWSSTGQWSGGGTAGQPPYGQPPYGQPPYGQPPYGQPPAGQPNTPPTGQPNTQPPPVTVGADPINQLDQQVLRQRAGMVLNDLKGGLNESAKQKVQGIPLFADPAVGEVNAFAACDDSGQPLMAISDGLLEVMAFSARFKATDEQFGTRKLDQYTQLVASGVKPKKPLPRPPASMIDPAQDNDPRKIARQNLLFDEQLAFVLGHELAHHHLGHTGCANGGGSRGVGAADFGRLLSRAVPLFNQPNEVSADVAGTNNLLAAGATRQVKWSEEGAMLSLGFFSALDRLTPESILFGFESTHPPPQLRIPIVQNAANTWRLTGGNTPSFPIPLPF